VSTDDEDRLPPFDNVVNDEDRTKIGFHFIVVLQPVPR
jgi:hypothetical protein